MGSVGHLWKGDQTTNKMRVKHGKVPCYARFYPCAIPPVPNLDDNSFLTAYSLKRREFSQSHPTGCPCKAWLCSRMLLLVRSLALDRVCGFMGTGHPASRYYWFVLLLIASILLRRTLSVPTLVWWLRRLGESSTCASLKRSLLSSIKIERIILGLRSCVTHRNRAVGSISTPWGGG